MSSHVFSPQSTSSFHPLDCDVSLPMSLYSFTEPESFYINFTDTTLPIGDVPTASRESINREAWSFPDPRQLYLHPNLGESGIAFEVRENFYRTEVMLLEKLVILEELFILPLRTSKRIISKRDHQAIFSQFSLLKQLIKSNLSYLRAGEALSCVFADLQRFLDVYLDYTHCFHNALWTYARCNSSSRFASFIEEVETGDLCSGTSFLELFLSPLLRIQSYRDLLDNMNHPQVYDHERTFIRPFTLRVMELVHQQKNCWEELDNYHELASIQQSLGINCLLSSYRKVEHIGQLYEVSEDSANLRHVYVLSDCLLLATTRVSRSSGVEPMALLPFSKLEFSYESDKGYVKVECGSFRCNLTTKSFVDLRLWLDVLTRTQYEVRENPSDEYLKKKIVFEKSGSMSLWSTPGSLNISRSNYKVHDVQSQSAKSRHDMSEVYVSTSDLFVTSAPSTQQVRARLPRMPRNISKAIHRRHKASLPETIPSTMNLITQLSESERLAGCQMYLAPYCTVPVTRRSRCVIM